MPRRQFSRRWRLAVTASVSTLLVAAALTAASATGAGSTPADTQTGATPEPAEQVPQLAERDSADGRVTVSGRGGTVCRGGATWLRLRFAALDLHGTDTVTLTGSGGGSLTLTAKNWPGKAFHTRALRGECVAVAANLSDPTSGYAIDAYQSGTRDLAAASVVVAGAGDLCGSACNQTATIVERINPTAVITAGDNAYNDGTAEEFRRNYDPNWGRFKAITFPSTGNHDYETPGAAGYFDYFGARAGARGKGYYSYDVGDWHFIALNSNISRDTGSEQERWLRADLAANTKPCTAAYWHHARFSRGDHGDNTSVRPFFQALYDHQADLVIVGHDHDYERFGPARPDGTRDDAKGVRQLVVGTGGASLRGFPKSSAGPSEVRNSNTFGVAKLTLSATGYLHEFVPVDGRTFTDRVSGTCHKAQLEPDFGVAVDPAGLYLGQGSTGTGTVSVSSLNGFSADTTLSVSGLPSGVTATFERNPVAPPAGGSATSTLTLTAAPSASAGTANVTITGKSGTLEHSDTLRLTVSAAGSPVFADTFEADTGWTVNPAGTDTATTGRWERGDPEQTTSTKSNQVKQLGTTPSGLNSLVTGRLAGSAAGTHDVDGGATSIRSPAVAVPPGSPQLSFVYNVAYDDSGPDDHLRVGIVDGTTVSTVFEKPGTTTNVAGAWRTATVDLTVFAGRTVRVQLDAADVGATSLFEAQVDDLRISGSGGGSTVYADTFEADTGWTVNPAGTDTATTGRWERGDPEQTANSGGVKQLGSTPSGVSCLSTGRLAGSGYGANDLDGGVTSIRSPAITLPVGTSTLSFAYNVAHDLNSGPDDHLRIRIVDGSTITTVFEQLGVPSDVDGVWHTATVDLSGYAGHTVRVQIDATDAGPATLFEAQVDDLTIVNG